MLNEDDITFEEDLNRKDSEIEEIEAIFMDNDDNESENNLDDDSEGGLPLPFPHNIIKNKTDLIEL